MNWKNNPVVNDMCNQQLILGSQKYKYLMWHKKV